MNSSQIYCVVKYWDNIEINIPSSSKPVVNKETTPTIEIQIISEHENHSLSPKKYLGHVMSRYRILTCII